MRANNYLSIKTSFVLLFTALWCFSCYPPTVINTTIPTLPTRAIKNPPTRIAVGNSYDVTAADVREKKEKLFAELINFTTRHISNEISRRTEIPASFEEGLSVPPDRSDSSVQAFMTRQQSSHAIIINSFNAYFEQTHVEVTQTEGSKDRRAFYDIIVDIGYSFYNWSGHQFDTLISVRKFHSSRRVLSGLLAVGPGIVANSEDAADGIYANVDIYLKSFFRGTENRNRTLFTYKELKGVGEAIQREDYESAFNQSEKLMSSPDYKTAARAAYNCAVLLEYQGKYDQVKYYLEESLRHVQLPEARSMIEDYRLYRAQHGVQ